MLRLNNIKKFIIIFLNLLGRFIFIARGINKSKQVDVYCFDKIKILIIELWGIGDLIMMSSILSDFKKKYPFAQINLLCKPIAKELFGNTTLIDKYIEFDFPWTKFKGKYRFWKWDWKGLLKIIRRLRNKKFDLALDARGDFRNNLLSFLIGVKRRIGYDWTGGGYFLTDVVKFDYKNKHRVDAWINLLEYIGIKVENPHPYLCISEDEKKWVEDFLKEKGIKEEDLLIGIHPGARIRTRCWPLDRFAKVAEIIRDKYNAKIIVFADPQGYGEDIPIEGEFIKIKHNLRELIVLISKLGLLICNDGGAMHIATAVNTPVVAIFGPTNPIWFGPYGDNNSIIIKENIKCRPCFDYCKYKEPFCLTSISVEGVLKEVDTKIKAIESKKVLDETFK